MGYTVYMKQFYGVKMPAGKIFAQTKTRGCAHAIQANAKFCGECGKPAWVSTETRLLDSEDNGLSYAYSDPENWQDADILVGFGIGGKVDSYSPQPHALAYPAMTGQDQARMDKEIEDFCKQVGFPYKNGDAKMWTYLYHSY